MCVSVCLDSRSICRHLYMSTHISIHTVHNVQPNSWLFLFIHHECHCSTFYLVDSVFVYNKFKYIYTIYVYSIPFSSHKKKHCILLRQCYVFKFFWVQMDDDILDFTDFIMRWWRWKDSLNNKSSHCTGQFGLSSCVLWNVWINRWSYVTLRAKMSSVASQSFVSHPLHVGWPPPTPHSPLPGLTPSVHVHRRDRRGWDLIQDATYVARDVHETLFVHQNEGMFLEERREQWKKLKTTVTCDHHINFLWTPKSSVRFARCFTMFTSSSLTNVYSG